MRFKQWIGDNGDDEPDYGSPLDTGFQNDDHMGSKEDPAISAMTQDMNIDDWQKWAAKYQKYKKPIPPKRYVAPDMLGDVNAFAKQFGLNPQELINMITREAQ